MPLSATLFCVESARAAQQERAIASHCGTSSHARRGAHGLQPSPSTELHRGAARVSVRSSLEASLPRAQGLQGGASCTTALSTALPPSSTLQQAARRQEEAEDGGAAGGGLADVAHLVQARHLEHAGRRATSCETGRSRLESATTEQALSGRRTRERQRCVGWWCRAL